MIRIRDNSADRLVIEERPWIGIAACLLFAPPALYNGIAGTGGDDLLLSLIHI